MSYNKAKRPKVEDVEDGGGGSMADILAEMQDMKSKLSRMDEMQNEIDSMKGKLLQMDDLKKEISKRDDYINSEMSEMDELVSKCKHLEDKCKHFEDKCGKLEKRVKVLVKDWKYSAPEIPASYWEDKGYGEEYIELIREFLSDIKEQTLQLRNGEEMDVSFGFDFDGPLILQHDDALLPHWTELAIALQLYHSDDTYDVVFKNMQLTPSIIDILAPALKENQIKSLSFIGIELDSSYAIRFSVDIMKASKHLTDIDWAYTRIDSKDDARDLSLAISSHPSINHVRFENCFGVERSLGYSMLCDLFQFGNKIGNTIDLEGNHIRTGGLQCNTILHNKEYSTEAALLSK